MASHRQSTLFDASTGSDPIGDTLLILACSKSKMSRAAPAEDLYTSSLFQLSKEWAKSHGGDWAILSAQHGIITPDTPTAPYDVTLSDMSESQREYLAQRIRTQLMNGQTPERLVVLGGARYVDVVRNAAPHAKISNPLQGLSIGYRLRWLKNSMSAPRSALELESFYELLSELAGVGALTFKNIPTLAELLNSSIPEAGVYFFLEDGEHRTGRKIPRVTRVGTHRVSSGSKSTLRSRLRTHAGTRTLEGSHRSSIFRLHVGSAIISQNPARWASASSTWGKGSGSVATMQIREAERELEREVSRTIQAMHVVTLPVFDDAGKYSDRAFIEQNSIALLASTAVDDASPTWLGRNAANPVIGRSRLWNLNHVDQLVHPQFVEIFSQLVAAKSDPPTLNQTSRAVGTWNAPGLHSNESRGEMANGSET